MKLKDLKIRNKIILMLFIPILGLMFFAVNGIVEKFKLAREMDSVESLSSLAVRLSALVHETQKERGMTAGFLGSEGKKFKRELQDQRKRTDEKIGALDHFLGKFKGKDHGSEFNELMDSIQRNLSLINSKREGISALKITVGSAISFYTNLNSLCLDVIAHIPKICSYAGVSILTSGYANFLQGKESAGIERAVLSNTFARDQFGSKMYNKFMFLVRDQETYLKIFFSFASREQKSYYENKVRGRAVDEVERMRNVAFEKAGKGNFEIDPVYWFNTQTEKINLLKEVEDKLSIDLNVKAEDVKHQAENSLAGFVVIALTSVLLAIISAVFLARSIIRPVRDSVGFANVLATGDFSTRLNMNSRDEIGELGKALDRMAVDLGKMIQDIKECADLLGSASSELSTVSIQLSNNSQKMTHQSETVAGATEEMSTNIGAMASAAEEMSVNIQGISSGAEKMSTNVNTIASAIEEMSSSIQGVAQNAGEAAKVSENATTKAQDTSRTMNTLAEAAREIGQVIGDIKKIAEQTNLLALNATIEAASAGEAGRGFAVVANEVKELANQSAQAAENITSRIEGVQQSTSNAVSAIGEITSIINNINSLQARITSSVNEQTSAANEIAQNVAEAARGANNIATSISEIAQGSNEVSKNAGEAAKGSNDVAESIQNVYTAARETNDGGARIKTSSEDLSKMANELRSLVENFKIK